MVRLRLVLAVVVLPSVNGLSVVLLVVVARDLGGRPEVFRVGMRSLAGFDVVVVLEVVLAAVVVVVLEDGGTVSSSVTSSSVYSS